MSEVVQSFDGKLKMVFVKRLIAFAALLASLHDATARVPGQLPQPVTSDLVNPDPSVKVDTKPAKNPDNPYAAGLYEGDMRDAKPARTKRNVLVETAKIWPRGNDGKVTINYWFDTAKDKQISAIVKSAFNAAKDDYTKNTCIRFVEKTQAECGAGQRCLHVHKANELACWSDIGMKNPGDNHVSLGSLCNIKAPIIHELMHTLGFGHEQSRDDRDEYITVNVNNAEMPEQWDKMHLDADTPANDYGFPYDCGSVMHYGQYYPFAKGLTKVYEPKDPSKCKIRFFGLGNMQGFSQMDIQKINKVYCDTLNNNPGQPKPGVASVSLEAAYGADMVKWLNDNRALLNSNNMQKIAWDTALATKAVEKSKDCTDREPWAEGDVVYYQASTFNIDPNYKAVFAPVLQAYLMAIFPFWGSAGGAFCSPTEVAKRGGTPSPHCNVKDYGLINAAANKVGCGVTLCLGMKNKPTWHPNAEYTNVVCALPEPKAPQIANLFTKAAGK